MTYVFSDFGDFVYGPWEKCYNLRTEMCVHWTLKRQYYNMFILNEHENSCYRDCTQF